MSTSTISRIIVRVLRWSSTSNAAARPDSCTALRMTLRASPKYCDSTAHSKPITQSGTLIHTISALQALLSNRRATVKSP